MYYCCWLYVKLWQAQCAANNKLFINQCKAPESIHFATQPADMQNALQNSCNYAINSLKL